MATELGKAYVQIIPSAKGISGSISSSIGGEATSAGKSAGLNIAGAIKGAIAAAGIGTAIKSALEAGGNLQQSFGGLDTLYGDASAAAKEYAAEAAKAGISANDYAEQAVSFGASLKAAFSGDTVKAAEAANTAIMDMADNSAKMGTDITAVQTAYQGFAKQNYTMLDNLKLGYGGTKQEMQRLLADAEKLSGVHYDLDNLGDVYSAIHVIQEDLGLTGVAADEASTTFTGSLGAMKAAGENLLANIALGEDIQPALNTLLESVQTFIFNNLVPMLGNIVQALPQLIEGLSSALIQGLNMITNNADQIVQIAVEVITQLATALISAAPYLIEAAVALVKALGSAIINTDWITIASNMLTALQDNLSLAAGEILGTDGSIIQGVLDSITANLPGVLAKGSEIIMNIVTGLLEAIPSLIASLGTILGQFIEFWMQNYPVILEQGLNLAIQIGSGILKALPEILAALLTVLADLLQTIVKNLPQFLQKGVDIINQIISGLGKMASSLIAKVKELISGMVDSFLSFEWVDVGINIVEGIIGGIKDAADNLFDSMKDLASNALQAAKDALGIESPSKEGRYLGKMIDAGIAKGVTENLGMVDDAMEMAANRTIDDFKLAGNVNFDARNNNDNASRMDLLIAMLGEYLPVIAANRGITEEELYNNINRQLGWGVS